MLAMFVVMGLLMLVGRVIAMLTVHMVVVVVILFEESPGRCPAWRSG
jgi:hypothetical protein